MRVSVLLAVLVTTVRLAGAQDADRPDAMERGAIAVLYQVEAPLRLNFYEGMLAMKYHFSERRALRVGLGGNARSATDGQDSEAAAGGAQLQGVYLLYPRPGREVKFFLGAGPQVGYSYQTTEFTPGVESRVQRYQLGIVGRLGTEWFATRHISVLAEYGNELSRHVQRTRPPGAEARTAREIVYTSGVTLGLSAYL